VTNPPRSKDPLHGVTLEAMVNDLVAFFGWEELAQRISIRCFSSDPSIKSSLKFLRKTPRARQKVEGLYQATRRARLRNGRSSSGGRTGAIGHWANRYNDSPIRFFRSPP